MSKVKIVIGAISKDGKKLKDQNAEQWYSAFNASQIGSATRGDTVEFEMTQNGQWMNIKGNVTVCAGEEGGQGNVTTMPGSAPPVEAVPLLPHYVSRKGYTNLERQWPLPEDHPDMSFARQTALECASRIATPDDSVETVLEMARDFELYLTGKDSAAAMDAFREAM